jgi:hypothetical protein
VHAIRILLKVSGLRAFMNYNMREFLPDELLPTMKKGRLAEQYFYNMYKYLILVLSGIDSSVYLEIWCGELLSMKILFERILGSCSQRCHLVLMKQI